MRIQRLETFSKCLRDLDATALKNFDSRVKDLESSHDPTSFAEYVPTRTHGRCWVRRLTKLYRLAYRVIHENDGIIQLITTGDHKKIFGRDKHS
jgi:mRNA-degrading endonuclease RelE of RelBE toxin-antitoxin system